MNRTIRKSAPLIMIAMLLATFSISLTQVQGSDVSQPQPTGSIFFYPSISNVAIWGSSVFPPSSGEEERGEFDGETLTDLAPTSDMMNYPFYSTYQIYPLPDIKTNYFYVYYNTYPRSTSQRIEVFLHYNPNEMSMSEQMHLRLYVWDPVDLNLDGKVDQKDVAMEQEFIMCLPNPYFTDLHNYDFNHDGVVNNTDLLIVQQFATNGLLYHYGPFSWQVVRLPWLDITAGVDTTNHYVYGFTDFFSVFGVH